jgi:hypothetical protein
MTLGNIRFLAIIIAATTAPALAEPIDASTPCSIALHAFGSAKRASNFSDAGKHAIAGSAVANCRLHPRRTIFEAADAVYRSVREIHIKLGIVK